MDSQYIRVNESIELVYNLINLINSGYRVAITIDDFELTTFTIDKIKRISERWEERNKYKIGNPEIISFSSSNGHVLSIGKKWKKPQIHRIYFDEWQFARFKWSISDPFTEKMKHWKHAIEEIERQTQIAKQNARERELQVTLFYDAVYEVIGCAIEEYELVKIIFKYVYCF
jgi:hypothetical protein